MLLSCVRFPSLDPSPLCPHSIGIASSLLMNPSPSLLLPGSSPTPPPFLPLVLPNPLPPSLRPFQSQIVCLLMSFLYRSKTHMMIDRQSVTISKMHPPSPPPPPPPVSLPWNIPSSISLSSQLSLLKRWDTLDGLIILQYIVVYLSPRLKDLPDRRPLIVPRALRCFNPIPSCSLHICYQFVFNH